MQLIVVHSERPATRFKPSPQQVTAEFLRERFSESPSLAEMDGDVSLRKHNWILYLLTVNCSVGDSSLHAGATSGEMNSFQTNLPVATSTPQQSLRMSFNSQFQSSERVLFLRENVAHKI